MKNNTRILVFTSALLIMTFSAYSQQVFKVGNVGIGTTSPAQKLEIAGTTNTIRVGGLVTGGTYNAPAVITSNLIFVNNATGDLYSLPNGTSGTVLSINSGGVPTWVTPTTGTVTQVTANLPLSVTNPTTTPAISLIGTAGTLLYGTGTASAFTTAGTAGQILESAGTGVPTWVTGSGQFIQNQSSAQQTANFWISGNASIGTAPVSTQLLTVSESGSSTIGILGSNTAGSGTGVEGSDNGGGTGVLGTVSGNTSSNNGGYGVEGAASSGGVGVWANSSGQTNATPAIGGYGVFATGTSNSQAGVFSYLGTSAPSPHGTTIPALGAVYGQTNSTTGSWAVVANNSGSATPTNNGLLVFGTTSEIGAVTLGANSTSYFTTGGAKANGTLVFDNSTNTNTVTINTGITTASYPLTLPTTQGVANSLLYNADGAGTLTFSATGTSGQVLTANSSGVPTWSTPSGGTVTGVGTTAPIYNTGTPTSPVIAIQGLPSGSDAGGVLYSTGSGSSAVFNSTGTTGQVLVSGGAGAPSWASANAALTTSNITNTGSGSSVVVGNGNNQVVGVSPVTLDVQGASGGIFYGTGAGISAAFTSAGTSGQVLESTGTGVPTWVTPTTGTVTSVAVSVPSAFNVSGSPIATNGTLTITGAGTTAQYIDGTGALQTFPTLSPGTVTSVGLTVPASSIFGVTPTTTNPITSSGSFGITTSGNSGGIPYFSSASALSSSAALTQYGIVYGGGAGAAPATTAVGTAGQILQSTGTGAPTWVTPTTGTVTSVSANLPLTVTGGASPTPTLNLIGTAGTILYGTGTASAFNSAGTSGEILKSTGTSAPIWAPANSVLATNNIAPGTGSSVVVTNGAGQVVGGSNVSIDVQGTAGGIFYGQGTGAAAAFTTAGTAGQILESAGTGVPTWVTGSGQFIQNQNSVQQTANFWISGNAGIGTAPVSTQQLTVASASLSNTALVGATTATYGGTTTGQVGVAGLATGGAINYTVNTGSAFSVNSGVFGSAGAGNGTTTLGFGVVGLLGNALTTSNPYPAGAGVLGAATSSGIGVAGYTSGGSGIGVEGMSSSTGTGVVGEATGSNGIGVEGYSNNGGAALYGRATGSNGNGSGLPTGGYGVFATGTSNSEAAVYGNLVAGSPAPSATLPPAIGAIYGQTTLSGTWALVANNSVNATPTGNGLLVFGTTNAVGALTLGSNITSYFTTGGATANGSLVFDNSTNTNTVTINTGATSPSSYSLTLPVAQGATGSILYNTNGAGALAFSTAGTSGQVLTANTGGVPTWATVNSSLITNNIVPGTGSSVFVGNGTGQVVGASNVTVDVRGTTGGIFYGTGTGTAAAFTTAGTSGQVLQSTGTGAPIWTTPTTGTVTSVSANTPLTVTGGASPTPTLNLIGTAGTILYGTGTASAFTTAGTSGEVLKSTGTSAPIWATANSLLTTSDITPGTGSSVFVGNGTGQVVGASDVTVDVRGTTGGIFYGTGTGTAAAFTTAGTSGQVLQSTGTGSPIWATPTTGTVTSVSANTPLTVTGGASPTPTLNLIGTAGTILYGTGTASAFTTAGTSGEVLKSTGTSAPIWATANSLLTTSDITPGTGSSVFVGNGTGQVVGASDVTVDVRGTTGGIFYGTGTGTAAAFTTAGTSGQVLQSTGTGSPIWATPTTGTVTSVSANTPLTVTGGASPTPTLNLIGSVGTVLYGTGTASAFTSAGTSGEVLKSNGTSTAPSWATTNSLLSTSNIVQGTGSAVVVTNGTGQVVGSSNVTLDVRGTTGGIFYGTGTGAAAAFTTAGTSGEVLQSTGTGAPTWATFNSLFNPSDIVPGTGSSVVVTNGANQVVGASNVTVDVRGTAGGIFYGTGTGAAAAFTTAGTSGEVLESSGTGSPTWATQASLESGLLPSGTSTQTLYYNTSNVLTATSTLTNDGDGDISINQTTTATGSPTALTVIGAANATAYTASTENPDVYFDLSRTETFAAGDIATQAAVDITPPTYAFSTSQSTITNAATVDITGPPVAGGSHSTITNASSLLVQSGNVNIESGDVGIGTTAPQAHLTIDDGHIKIAQGTAPTIAVSTGNGITAAAIATNSTDVAGTITTTGTTTQGNNTVLTVTFKGETFNVAPFVTITPANASAALASYFVTSSTTGFVLTFTGYFGGSAAPSYTYMVIE